MSEKIENRPDYPELDISSKEAIIDWYHSLGPMTEIVINSEYQPGTGQVPVGELFQAASWLYLYATGDRSLDGDFSQKAKDEAGINLIRVIGATDYDKRIVDDLNAAVEVGNMLVEICEVVPKEKAEQRDLLHKTAATIFATIATDARLDRGKDNMGGVLKFEAVRYFNDVKTQHLRDLLERGAIEEKVANEKYKEIGLKHAEKFLQFSDRSSGATNGELFEHFTEIVTRYEIWKNGDLMNLAIRSAKPRQDQPNPGVLRDANGKKLAFDSLIIDLKTDKAYPLQSKLDDWAGVHEYSALISIVDSLAGMEATEARKKMHATVSDIKACYNARNTPMQESDVDEEFARIVSNIEIFEQRK